MEAAAGLLEEGGTVPFIARYRKEATGSLDEVQITAIRDRLARLAELDKRREAILRSLKERELLNRPLLYLSEFFDQHKDEYYRRLLAVSQRGDWQAWFEFFLRGVTHQARAAVEYARRLEKLHEEYVKKLGSTKKIPGASHRLLEETFKNPVISVW